MLATEKPPDVDESTKIHELFSFMRDQYMNMLKSHITAGLVWVLDIFPFLVAGSTGSFDGLIPANGASSLQRLRRCRGAMGGDPNDGGGNAERRGGPVTPNLRLRTYGLYCSVIAWYVVRNAKFVLESNDIKARLRKFLEESRKPQASNEDNQGNTVAVEDALGCVLRWFHSHSIIHRYETLFTSDQPEALEADPYIQYIAHHRRWADH